MSDSLTSSLPRPLLEVKNLSIRLHGESRSSLLVDDVSFQLERGQTTALVGESGSGKSLTARALLGLVPYLGPLRTSGSVWFEGQDLLDPRSRSLSQVRGKKISMIFQNPMQALNPVLSIGEQLIETALEHVTDSEEEAYDLAIQQLKEVKLSDPEMRMSDYPHQLSGGMRQRVLIALALIAHPQILIADEPTTALDMTVQRQILDLLHELQARHGMAILLVTHDISIVSYYADQILVMYASQMIEKGPCLEVLNHPNHPYTQGLLRSKPHWQSQKVALQSIPGQVPSIDNMPTGCHFHPRCPHAWEQCTSSCPPAFATTSERWNRCWLYKEKS